jgi:hypothetical protein
MAVKRERIEEWFDKGIADGRKYMIVLCDTFDWEDYPEYFDTQEAVREKTQSPGNMQKVMEVYDLTAQRDTQLLANRAFAL